MTTNERIALYDLSIAAGETWLEQCRAMLNAIEVGVANADCLARFVSDNDMHFADYASIQAAMIRNELDLYFVRAVKQALDNQVSNYELIVGSMYIIQDSLKAELAV
jgi:hypothetical protein